MNDLVFYLRLVELHPSLPDEPGGQGGEEVELLPRVRLEDKVVTVQRPHTEVLHKVL